MSLALAALAVVAASTAVRLDQTVDVPLQTSRELAVAFTAALGDRLGEPVVLDDPDWASCESESHCLAAVRARTQASDVVLLRLIAGPTMIRVVAVSYPQGAVSPKATTSLDVPREARGWATPLATLAKTLFPEVHAQPRKDLVGTELPNPQPQRRSALARLLPWASIGAGAAAGVAGVVLGTVSAGARSEARSSFHYPTELDDLDGRATRSAIGADVLFGLAVVGLATGIVLLATD